MSVRNNKLSSKKSEANNFYTTHTLVRSEVFYYLKFTNYDRELFNSGSRLKSKPTLIFYTKNSTDKVVLDYSFVSETDRKYLSSFFTNMNTGDVFTVTNGSYIDDTREVEADVSCSLTFNSYNNDKIVATVTSITNKNTAIDIYEANFFVGIPQLSKTGSLGDNISTENMALVSVTNKTKNKLETLGLIPGDYVEVINPNSANDKKVYKVLEYSVLNDREIIKIEGTPLVESLIGSPTLVNVYIKGLSILPQSLVGDLGCCYKDDVFIKNNTEYQCSVRKEFNFNNNFDCSFNEINQTIRNSSNSFIPEIVVTSGSNVSLTSDLKFNINIKRTPTRIFSNNFGLATETTLELIPINVTSNIFSDDTIILNINQTVSFVQTDLSSFGYFLRFSTNKEKFEPYIETYGFTSKNGIGSSYLLTVSRRTPLKIYLFVETILNGVNKYYPSKYSIEINPFL